MYCCAAYSLLSSVIVCTQTNEQVFANFLFSPRQGGAQESLWSLLIDTSQDFEFKVQTNFNHVELRSIEQKLADSEAGAPDVAGRRVQSMMSEYLTSSFMGANEGFNQNMVFETQLDSAALRKEEQKLQEVFDRKFHPHSRQTNGSPSSLPSLPDEEAGAGSQDRLLQDQPELQEQEVAHGAFIPEEEAQFELDAVNKHWCMKNIKRCIERMKVLFGEEWKSGQQQMPRFARHLLAEFSQPETHPNVKVFILKIVTNNPKLFKPHANLWFESICEHVASKDKRGKGFHYFLRDLCTMLISWDYVPEESAKAKRLLTDVVNSLVLISADKIKLIFKQNIQIIGTLMRKWRHLIAVNKLVLAKMISLPDSEPESHLWKMNAIEVLALAVCYRVPVLVKPEEIEVLPPAERKFKLQAGNRCDPLMMALLKLYESKKK
jgi:DNA-dependent protein kinase catalytic subunit